MFNQKAVIALHKFVKEPISLSLGMLGLLITCSLVGNLIWHVYVPLSFQRRLRYLQSFSYTNPFQFIMVSAAAATTIDYYFCWEGSKYLKYDVYSSHHLANIWFNSIITCFVFITWIKCHCHKDFPFIDKSLICTTTK